VLLARFRAADEMNEDEVGGARSTRGDMRDVYGFLVGKPEGRRPFGKPGYRWGIIKWGHAVAQLLEALRYKPRKVAGSILDGVGIFH